MKSIKYEKADIISLIRQNAATICNCAENELYVKISNNQAEVVRKDKKGLEINILNSGAIKQN